MSFVLGLALPEPPRPVPLLCEASGREVQPGTSALATPYSHPIKDIGCGGIQESSGAYNYT